MSSNHDSLAEQGGCALAILFCLAFWAGTLLLWWLLR